MKITIGIFGAILAVLGVSNVLIIPVRALDANSSQLTQSINLIDCTTTVTGNANNPSAPPATACDGQILPTVKKITANSGRVLIEGTFNAAQARTFRVSFHGRSYTLGKDSELSAQGDAWFLDLTYALSPLPPGIFDVIAEVETWNNLLLRDADNHEVVIISNSSQPGSIEEVLKTANAVVPATGIVIKGATFSLQPVVLPGQGGASVPVQSDDEYLASHKIVSAVSRALHIPPSWVRAGIIETIITCLLALLTVAGVRYFMVKYNKQRKETAVKARRRSLKTTKNSKTSAPSSRT